MLIVFNKIGSHRTFSSHAVGLMAVLTFVSYSELGVIAELDEQVLWFIVTNFQNSRT